MTMKSGQENIVLKTLSLGRRGVGALSSAAVTTSVPRSQTHAVEPMPSMAGVTSADVDAMYVPTLRMEYSGEETQASEGGTNAPREDDQAGDVATQELPPVDGGREAYFFLACGFALEFTMWGPVFAVGTFTSFYADYFPNSSEVAVSAIGTCMSCLAYVMSTVGIGIFQRYRAYARPISVACLGVSVLSLIGASFANNIAALIALQGVLNGMACGMAFCPVFLFLPEWFNRRAGFAVGFVFSGNGLGGIAYPFLFQACLSNIGFRWTLRIWAALNLFFAGGALALVKPRLPVGAQKTVRRTSDALHDSPTANSTKPWWHYRSLPPSVQWFFTITWQLNSLANLIGSAGYLPVSMYLTQYMRYAGMSTTTATGGLAILNAAAFFGQLAVGLLVDRVDYALTMSMIGAIGCVSSLVLFGLSTSNVGIIVCFAIIFGATAGALGATWGRSARDISAQSGVPSGTVLPMFSAVKGVSALAGPFIAGALLQLGRKGESTSIPFSDSGVSDPKAPPGTFGSYGFVPLVIWVGCCMAALCAVGVVIRLVRINKHLIKAGCTYLSFSRVCLVGGRQDIDCIGV